MDPDRKSTVSSFYGRKGSADALNDDYPSPTGNNYGSQRTPRDDASSFFNPDHASRNLDNYGSAGYNRNSFFFAGREEPLKGGQDEEQGNGGFDIYADFNNAGPRYSSALVGNNDGYQPLPPLTPKHKEDSQNTVGPVELVTVPALGPEWQRSELHDMSKAGRREKKRESRQGKWTAWKRGERGMCGKWFTRRVTVFFLFGLAIVVGILLAIMVPRVPSVTINSDTPLANATGDWKTAVPTYFNRSPANFSFPAYADLQLNTGSNILPLIFSNIKGYVYDLDTSREIATGSTGHKTVPAKSFPEFLLPLNFSYIASNDSDATWNNWYDGCRNAAASASGARDSVKFKLILEMDIVGLIGSRSTTTQVTNANCPIELSISAA
ncbi:uncharacterized protein BT62DRAFT_952630 [Guyanagaster necrorhizus]|uniref:Uncharacterized protein n=1 Tax=Guyanagaster necrorhizus TaxID=856835 RepID=A0A9P8AQN7_9AGAR|nr:uncharacterized protein BT62DRAFT_952630 [Guyanagaster necrorhizus MCA 3950]KAG7444185.1 hypothetical protein BT62DRAFT_952630 [Guyanagaster necrorhizus MCA 3950]